MELASALYWRRKRNTARRSPGYCPNNPAESEGWFRRHIQLDCHCRPRITSNRRTEGKREVSSPCRSSPESTLKISVVLRPLFANSRPRVRRAEELVHQSGDLIGRRIQCEVTGIQYVNPGIRHVLAIALRLAGIE